MVEETWSLDDGFGDFKGFNGKRSIILPNYEGRWQPIPQNDVEGDFEERQSHITYFEQVKEGELPRKRLVGLGAQLLGKNVQWDGQENKHMDERKYKVMFSTILGLMAEDYMDEEIHINPLVFSIPVDQETEERKKQIAKLVKGEHKIHLQLADGTVIEKTVHIDSLVIKNQPFGSYCYHVLDEKGNIKDSFVKGKVTAIFDLGARTLNGLLMRGFAQQSVESGFSFTEPTGMYSAWEVLQDEIKGATERHISLPKVKLVASEGEGGGNGYLTDGTDVRHLIEDVYEEHSNANLTIFERRLISVKDEIDDLLVTGGGSGVLSRHLVPQMKRRFSNSKVVTLGRTATAEGLRRYGLMIRRKMAKDKQKAVNTPPAQQEATSK